MQQDLAGGRLGALIHHVHTTIGKLAPFSSFYSLILGVQGKDPLCPSFSNRSMLGQT